MTVSTKKNGTTKSKSPQATFPFKLTPIAAVIAGLHLIAAVPSYAADDKEVAELQAEVTRLKQALAASQQELEKQKSVGATAASVEQADAGQNANGTQKKVIASQATPEEPVALDAVVVRSRNRIEKLQDVPLSVSVVTGKELERLGASDISAITRRAGNVSWNFGNQRTSSLSIRGIGKQGQTEAQDPAVGLMVDGISYAYNALSSSYDFLDVDTIEVTRGPQGTLLGKNASLGAVVVTTKKPSFTPSAEYSVTIGQQDTVKGWVTAGGPVVDNLLAWRGTFSASKGQGDIINGYNRDITYTNTDRLTGKVQFLLTPSEDFTARISLDATPRGGETTNGRTIYRPTPTTYASGVANNSVTNDVRLQRAWFQNNTGYSYAANYLNGGPDGSTIYADAVRPLVTGSNGGIAELNWNLGSHTLTSITGYKEYHFNAVNDEGTPFDVARNSGGFLNDYRQFTQEIRLSSQVGGFVDYQTGLYYSDIYNKNNYQKVWGTDAGAWFATNAQYATLDPTAGGALKSSGNSLLRSSLANLSMSYNSPTGLQSINNISTAAFGQANWHFTDQITLTTGARITEENRTNTGTSKIVSNGDAPELNPVSVNGVNLGGFNSNGTTGALAGANSTAQLNLADQVAYKYFGVAPTGVPGAAYTSLSAQQLAQVAAAKGIRAAQIGVLFNNVSAKPFTKGQPSYVLSPSYKFSDDVTGYVSLQYGEKAGVAQLTNGVSNTLKPEQTTAYEIGFKSALLDKTLILNVDYYLMDVKNYQQTTQVVDAYTTALKNDGTQYYTNATGNVPKVQSKGFEIDAVYAGIKNTSVRFSGAFIDAKYIDYKNAPLPVEWNYTGNPYGSFRDLSGQALPGASKTTFNVGVDYQLPVWGDKVFHTSFNTAFNSKFNADPALSQYGWVKESYITDFSIGLGRRDKAFDVSLLIKNLFDDKTPLSRSPSSNTWDNYTPALPRWIGVVFTGKL
jgi:outer membrane receptor protein involved in Fe transport